MRHPSFSSWLTRLPLRGQLVRRRLEAGMSTAEYAVGTVAACGFAALLFKIVTSAEVRRLVTGLVTRALHLAG